MESAMKVVNTRQKMIAKEGVKGQICCYCSGPVIAVDIDTQYVVLCVPLNHFTKRKYYCLICSRRLIPSFG